MKKLSIYFIANIVALFISAYVLKLLWVDQIGSILIASLVLALINIFIRPLVVIISLPVNLITLGVFTLIVDTLMIMLTDKLVTGIQIHGFLTTVVIALIVYVSSAMVKPIIEKK
jgi:putative membrane protein